MSVIFYNKMSRMTYIIRSESFTVSDLVLCSLFKRIWEREEKYANAKLSDFGLTFTQSNALEYIVERNGAATQKDLEYHMEIQHSAVVGIVSRLEAKGMIVTTPCDKDRRQKLLFPTELGRKTCDNICEDKNRVARALIEGFSDDEIKVLEGMLMRVYTNLADD